MAFSMDYGQVRRLGYAIGDAGDELSGAASPGAVIPFLPTAYEVREGAAFGNTAGAAACHGWWQSVAETAGVAASRLASALYADADRLDQVIFLFMTTDHETADEIASAGTGQVTFLSAHIHSGNSATDDYLRATQLDRLVNHAAGLGGPVVVGVDANTSTIPAELRDTDVSGPRAVNRFGTEGFADVGDVAGGRAGEGTSHSGQSIDYVFNRGVATTGDPDLVDGASSDHDGQAVVYRDTGW
jgi:endonuclease/exonuclease/phosphatase (EEP) superfamily protein YafD